MGITFNLVGSRNFCNLASLQTPGEKENSAFTLEACI